MSSRVLPPPAEAPDPKDQIGWLAIPTAGRPKEIARAVESYGSRMTAHGRSTPILVSEDGSRRSEKTDTQQIVERYASRSGRSCVYLGPGQKAKLRDELAQMAEVPREILDFALFGIEGYRTTSGANRNAILLRTAGDLIFSADDDTLCDPRVSAETTDSELVRFGAECDPTCAWFFSGREDLFNFTRPAAKDVLAAHELLLGHSPREVGSAARQNGGLDTDAACSHLKEPTGLNDGRIVITVNGAAGDSGMFSPRPLLLCQEKGTRGRLTATQESFDIALNSRELLRHAPVATVCHGSPLMGMFLGLDNRCILPPFLPVGRAQDGVFAFAVSRVLENSFTGHLPFSLPHVPDDARVYTRGASSFVRISDVMSACIGSWCLAQAPIGSDNRLKALGGHLSAIGSLDHAAFDLLLRTLMRRQAHERISRLEQALTRYESLPAYWAREVSCEIDRIGQAVERPDYHHPVDGPSGGRADARFRTVQRLVGRFGDVLKYWPQIVMQARRLNRDRGS